MSDIEAGLSFLQNGNDDTTALREYMKHIDDRFIAMGEKLLNRKQHFHNLSEADPKLPPPHEKGIKFQSDRPRRTHSKLKTRLTENHFVVTTSPERDTTTGRAAAQKQDDVLNNGLQLIEERERLDIQGFLSDGQVIYGFAMLHWSKAVHIYPEVPDYEETEVLPLDPAEAKRFSAKEGGGYKETDDSVQNRAMRDRARAGFPFFVEVPYPEVCRWVEDRSLANGLGAVLLKRDVPTYDYLLRFGKSKTLTPALSVDEATDGGIHGENAPSEGDPSRGDWGETVTLWQLWTRDECYEVIQAAKWEVMKAFHHPYEMPPFELCAWIEINESDPVLRFEPALEGLYRIKPFYDYMRSLELIAAEETALPLFFLQKVGSAGFASLTEEGKPVLLTRNAAASMQIPDGYELKQFDQRLSPAFPAMVAGLDDEFQRAEPSTGSAEISGSTQPWSIRLQQSQESVEPSKGISNQQRAIQGMARNMALVASKPVADGGTGPIAVFGRTTKGVLDRSQVVAIQPEEWISLDIDVKIENKSAAERVTLMQVGMEMLKAGTITLETYLREFEGVENAVATLADLRATKMAEEWLFPGILKQRVMKQFGNQFTMGPDGQFYNGLGQAVTPEQVLQAHGITPPPAPPAAPAPQPAGAAPGMLTPAPSPNPMPSMAPLATPNTIPIGAG